MSRNWDVSSDRIAGTELRDVRNIITGNGITTELFRQDWGVVDAEVVQIIHVSLRPGALSAWHKHERQTDHIFVVGGHLRTALYDGREDSPTYQMVNVHHQSRERPFLLILPPGVWHGLQVLGNETASFVNFFDHQYRYDDPDEWRLPSDTDEIPYRFPAV